MSDEPKSSRIATDVRARETREGIVLNPSLGATLQQECDSLRNDLQQANDLAADFQRQLTSKSSEVATMKQFFARTRCHLMQLQNSIKELRQERHLLANEAMKATAANAKLAEERDLLRRDLESLLDELDGCGQEFLRIASKFRRQIAESGKDQPAAGSGPLRDPNLPAVPNSDLDVKWIG